ncbi:hypothetical protein [Verminephrobacter eiseniae]|uniref:hypothetical protein n=1 Tax=Verminephrobacter eiseniae TaxID=364317 RepID=UPI002237FC5F|nr:hypothetical protein [Verminephrobacter eiseniae]
MSRHRSSVGLRWPSKRIAALHRLPIRSVWAARCALRYAPMAARSLRHLIGDATPAGEGLRDGRRAEWRRERWCGYVCPWCHLASMPVEWNSKRRAMWPRKARGRRVA